MRLPDFLVGGSRVNLIGNSQLIIYAGIAASLYSVIVGARRNSHHISDDVVIQIDISDLFTEVVLYKVSQLFKCIVC